MHRPGFCTLTSGTMNLAPVFPKLFTKKGRRLLGHGNLGGIRVKMYRSGAPMGARIGWA